MADFVWYISNNIKSTVVHGKPSQNNIKQITKIPAYVYLVLFLSFDRLNFPTDVFARGSMRG